MRKKGFTLVELLAVIVVLGIIMTIAGTAVLGQRKKANIEEAKKLEDTIKNLGAGIYSYEMISGVKDNESYCKKIENKSSYDASLNQCRNGENDLNPVSIDGSEYKNYFYSKYKESESNESEIIITLDELANTGYLKSDSIKNPGGNGNCSGYLKIEPASSDEMFKGYISCDNVYETEGYEQQNESSALLTPVED